MKKIMALLVTLALLSALTAGCSGTGAEPAAASGTETAAASPSEVAAAPPETAAAEDAAASQAPAQTPEVTVQPTPALPLTEETKTLSLYTNAPGGPPCVEDSWADLQIFKDAQALTNVRINWIEPSSSDQLALVIASGEYPDMINGMSSYASGLSGSYEEDIIIDLTDLIAQDMPSYTALVEQYDVGKDLATDEGRTLQVCVLYSRAEKADGIFVRKDWLNDLGLTVPATIDELTSVLKAFHTEHGCGQTLLFSGSGFVDDKNWISSAYGFACPNASDAATEHLYVGPDGKITSGLVQDAYKDYLKQVHAWYEAGYISVDFTAEMKEKDILAAVTTDDTGVFAKSCNTLPTYFSGAEDKGFDLAALGALSLDKGKAAVNDYYPATQIGRDGIAISSQCKDPELACKWLDYWYGQDGYYALNYGPEGVTWNFDENGNVQYTELITNDPQYNANTIIMKYNCQGKITGVHNVDSNLMVWTDKQIECARVFDENAGTKYILPKGISLTTEEANDYAVTFADIATYASEYLLRFINGEYDIDEKWQEFQNGMEGMNLSDCIAIYQAAYERYLSR